MACDSSILKVCKCAITLLLVLDTFSLCAQEDRSSDRPLFISASAVYGSFQVHTSKLEKYRGINPAGVEIEISRLFLTDKVREMSGTKVKLGLAINYTNFDHIDLGYGIGALFYIEPYFKCSKKWWLSGKGGIGLSYLSQPYNSISNVDNLSYSTHMAFPLFLGISSNYFFSPKWALKATVAFQHLSNGGVKQPNLGINFPTVALGIEHALDDYSLPSKNKNPEYTKENRIDFLMGYSLKEDTTHVNNTSVVSMFTQKAWQVSRINTLSLGGLIEYQQIHQTYHKPWSVGLVGGNEFLMGKFLFGQQMGIYLLEGYAASSLLFQNYYLRYKTNSRVLAGVNFKAHGHVADYLSFQLGYSF